MDHRNKDTRLFNPKRQGELQSFGRVLGYSFATVAAIVVGASVGLSEARWDIALIVTVAILGLMIPVTWLVTWRPTPTVQCHYCRTQGWIDDLIETAGDCPECNGETFNYYRYRGYQPALSNDRITGRDLVRLRQDIGLPWI